MFTKKNPKTYPHLVKFGKKGVMTLYGNFKGNWKDKGTKLIM